MATIYKTAHKSSPFSSQYPWIPEPNLKENPGGTITYLNMVECRWCPAQARCNTLGGRIIESNISNINPIKEDELYTPAQIRKIQHALHYKNFVANGLESIGMLYGTGNKANPVTRIGTWRILEANGNELKLRYDPEAEPPDVDPRNVGLFSYQVWREEEMKPEWISAGGSLQVYDVVTFSNDSILAHRVECKVIRLDWSTLEQGYFKIWVDQQVSNALYPSDPHKRDPADPQYSEPVITADIYRHASIPEQWIEPVNNDWLKCKPIEREWLRIEYPEDKVFELLSVEDKPCRVAILRGGVGQLKIWRTFAVHKWVEGEWQDITGEAISRVVVEQTTEEPYWHTKAYLGEILPNGQSGSSLIDDAEAVKIFYFAETTDAEHYVCPCLARCKHCKEDYNNIVRDGEKWQGRSFICAKRKEASGFINWLPGRCYQPGTCDKFEELRPFYMSADMIKQIQMGCNVYIQQSTPGLSHHMNFYIGRPGMPSGVPSIGWLLGLNQLTSAIQMFGYKVWIGHGAYGAFDTNAKVWTRGAFIDQDDWAVRHQAIREERALKEGILPKVINNWEDKLTRFNVMADGNTDPYKQIRRYFSLVQTGVIRDEGVLNACGHNRTQRFIEKVYWLPEVQKDQTQAWLDCSFQWGAWQIGAKTYKARINIFALAPFMQDWADKQGVKRSGITASIYQDLENPGEYFVECKLGKHCAALTVRGGGIAYDIIYAFDGGGNIAKPPVERSILSYYENDKSMHSREDGACEGDVIVWLPSEEHQHYDKFHNKAFFISYARDHDIDSINEYLQGTSGVSKSIIYQVAGFIVPLSGGGAVTTYKILEVRGYKKVNNEYPPDDEPNLVLIDDQIRPGENRYYNIPQDHFWCEKIIYPDQSWQYQNLILLSHLNCSRKTPNLILGDSVKFRVRYRKPGDSTDYWATVEYTADSTPTGWIIWTTEDDDFQSACEESLDKIIIKVIRNGEEVTMARVDNVASLAKDTYYIFYNEDKRQYEVLFHYQNAVELVRVYYPSALTLPSVGLVGLPPYYVSEVTDDAEPPNIIPNHPRRYWGGLRDRLRVIDEHNLLATYGQSLVDVPFEIRSAGVIHPLSDVVVSWTPCGQYDYQEVDDEAIWIDYAGGRIYLSEELINTIFTG